MSARSKVGGLGSKAEIGKTIYIGFAVHGEFIQCTRRRIPSQALGQLSPTRGEPCGVSFFRFGFVRMRKSDISQKQRKPKARPFGGGGSTGGCFLRCYDKLAVPGTFIRSAGLTPRACV